MILVGTFFLSLPISTESGRSLSFLDALFTSTSAVCVTGLVVVDTATTFSRFGESVIMVLMQLGGLGFMTFGVLYAILTGRKIGIKERLVLQQSFNQGQLQGIVRLTLIVFVTTLITEVLGIILLAIRWVPELGWGEGLFNALFHSISAFNNAGFDLFGYDTPFSSLTKYAQDPLINLTITGLFLIGGIGFVVIMDLLQYPKRRRLSLTTKLVLTAYGVLVVLGVLLVLLIEWSNPKTLASLSWLEKIVASFFQGLTPRSAGFSTLPIADMYPATQFILIMLMFIGAGPSSTGGGIKITTFVIVFLAVLSMIRGKGDVVSFRRRIPHEQVYRALTIFAVFLTIIVLVTIIFTITERTDLMTAMFEAVSAAGTSGLSLGLTPELTPFGKIVATIAMFAGRLGPLTLAFAIAQRESKELIRYPEEKTLTV
ncbi:TrkH family potassium uptake protein [Marininema mesophilum]|nr:TrkH family potassium uptake protein [Marininema mesophilum]